MKARTTSGNGQVCMSIRDIRGSDAQSMGDMTLCGQTPLGYPLPNTIDS